MSWHKVLWTPPKKGNAYFILAHAYIAAKLNILGGSATTPMVNGAIAFAEGFFATKTPTGTLSTLDKKLAILNAELLDSYNNGLIGPGHCSD